MKIFILDWNGTLDQLSDVPGFINQLRQQYPGCHVVLNTGWLYNLPKETINLFDTTNNKNTEYEILAALIVEIDHWCKIDDAYSIADVEEVVIIDDSLYSSVCERLSLRIQQETSRNISVSGYRSVSEFLGGEA